MGRRYRNPTYVRDKECPHCHTFFTPQGLSGHLRFAHKSAEEDKGLGARLSQAITERNARIQIMTQTREYPEDQIKEAQQWFYDWGLLIVKANILRVEFTEADFKEYMRARFMKSLDL
ncbi:MAG: hypothetical protein ABSF74_05505 [Dehalococcoidia bacterium]|jgi:hypothetical protein